MKNTQDILIYLRNEIMRLEDVIIFAESRLEGRFMVLEKQKIIHLKEVYNFINSY